MLKRLLFKGRNYTIKFWAAGAHYGQVQSILNSKIESDIHSCQLKSFIIAFFFRFRIRIFVNPLQIKLVFIFGRVLLALFNCFSLSSSFTTMINRMGGRDVKGQTNTGRRGPRYRQYRKPGPAHSCDRIVERNSKCAHLVEKSKSKVKIVRMFLVFFCLLTCAFKFANC